MSSLSNFFLRLDFIGPEVRLSNFRKNSHRYQTYFGAFLSLITASLAFVVAVYFSMDLIVRKNPKAYQVIRYQDDTPAIYFDESYINFGVMFKSSSIFPVNESSIVYYGKIITAKSGQILYEYKLERCHYDRDFQNQNYLFSGYQDEINNYWYCLSNMILNGTEIPKNDSRYVIPYTEHGMSSNKQDPIYFEVGGTRCKNSTANNFSCVPDEIIDNILLSDSNYRINFIDNMFDSNNYDHPVNPLVRQLMGSATKSTYSSNYVNLNNVHIITDNGYIFDNFDTIDSWSMQDRVEVVANTKFGDWDADKIFMFRLEGQNTPTFYERYYTTIQEVLAKIGSVLKCMILLSKLINRVYVRLVQKRTILKEVFLKYIALAKEKGKKKEKDVLGRNSHKSPNLIQPNAIKEENIPSDKDDSLESFEINANVNCKSPKTSRNKHEEHTDILSPTNIPNKLYQTIGLSSAPNLFSSNIFLSLKPLTMESPIHQNNEQMPYINKKTVEESCNLNFFRYLLLKIKQFATRKKPETIKNLEYSSNLKNNVFNEAMIYRLYFDMERLKMAMFDEKQRIAFENIKLDFFSLFKKKEKIDFRSLYFNLSEREDNISRKLTDLLGKSKKYI